ncbi:MAG TPA: Gfo/Idh/MocA family oxidoreductase [Phycisphaerae bacterium]|nr:Gfo/Idh/MocA family oxidoreductase [Phycisphaerae bacterium]
MKTIRVGIIGQGRSGLDIHAHHLATVPRKFRIVAVADLIADRCKEAERDLGCESSTNYRDLLKRRDLDLIVNATPSHLHVPITKEVLRAGFNVLCEKPLARRAREVDDLIAASKKARRLLAVYQQSRFSPYFVKIRQIIDSGVIGRVVMVKMANNGYSRRWDWQTLQSMNGGNLLNTGPHPVDQALVFFDAGGAMPKVWSEMTAVNTFGDAEDHVKLILSGKGHPTIDMEISSCCAYPTYSTQVYGTCGGVTWKGPAVTWRYFNPKRAPRQRVISKPMPGRRYCGEKLPWVEKTWEKPMTVGEMFDYMAGKFYDNLYAVMTRRAPLEVTPRQVRRQIAVIEEAHKQNPLPRRRS